MRTVVFILLATLLLGCSTIPVSEDAEKVLQKGVEIVEGIDPSTFIELARENGVSVEMVEDLLRDPSKNLELLKFQLNAFYDTQPVPEDAKVVANEMAKYIREIGPMNESVLKNYNEFKRQMIRVNRVIETVNDEFDTQIPEIRISTQYHVDLRLLGKTMGYLPLVDSYNRLYNSSLLVYPGCEDKYYKRFYRDLALLGAEIAFIESKLGYRVAFKGTWEIAQTLKLYNLRPLLGDKGYGLILSEVHWLLRGEFGEKWKDLVKLLEGEGVL